MVQWGTTPRQRHLVGQLSDIAARVAEAGLGSPAVVVVGPVAALAPTIGWLGSRPLLGRTVVVTRARAQASELSERLRALGASVVELPAIRIVNVAPSPALEETLDAIGDFGLVILTSVNGVEALFARLAERGRDARSLSAQATVVAIGPATAERLAAHGVTADVVPERFVAEGILEALADRPLDGVATLVARARGSRHLLIDGLEARGARVTELELYEALPEPADDATRAAAIAADYLTFTASSTVRSFTGLLDAAERARLADGPRVVSIGPITSGTAREEGLAVHARGERVHDPRPDRRAAGGRRAVSPRRPVVAFLTDFGAGSEYVGALHAVVARECPGGRSHRPGARHPRRRRPRRGARAGPPRRL